MRRRYIASGGDEAAAARFAWWAAFFATLTLVAVLGLARSAQALTIPATASPAVVVAPSSDEEFEEEAEASEDEDFEGEDCEEGEECEEEIGPGEAPPECLLTSAQASVDTATEKDRVRLQVRYTASAPTAVAVAYGLHGGKGSLFLGSEKRKLARQGVLRLTRTLTETQMTKATAAKNYTVRLRVPAAPGYCQSFFDYQLGARHATPSGLSWRPSE